MNIIDHTIGTIPHIGPILATMVCLGLQILDELQHLPERFNAEKELGKEASDVINDIALYGKNLTAKNHGHAERLEKKAERLENIARAIQRHIWEVSGSRQRHVRKLGDTIADFIECVTPTDVWVLQKQLQDAKNQFVTEALFMKTLQGDGEASEPPPYIQEQEDCKYPTGETFEHATWITKALLDNNPELMKTLVPVCPREATEDGVMWYIARVSYIGGLQPGKFKPGDKVAYFGHRRERLSSENFELLVAERDSVCWKSMSGTFSEMRLGQARLVRGCHENNGTILAISRAMAREHMHVGLLKHMFLQPGKASSSLEGAYVIAGEKEVHVHGDYEVLVYT